MLHKRNVIDVLSLIDQSTVDLASSIHPPVHPPIPNGARSRGGSALETSSGLLHRRMRRHQRDASLLPSRAKTFTWGVAVGSPGSATTSGCRIDLIGGFRVWFHDRVVELPLGAQRLISYLALEGSWVTRAYAAEMLWPDSRRRQAAANLRTALWRVRRQVGDDAVWTAPGRLALSETVTVDMQDAAKEARALID